MTEPTKKVIEFLTTNPGTFSPTQIQDKTGVSFRGVTTIKRNLKPELASRIVAMKPKRMVMVKIEGTVS